MSMDPWLVLQVVIGLIFANASRKGTPSAGLALLLLASWVTPVFFLGFFRAVLVWIVAMFAILVVMAIQEKLS